MQRLSGGPPPIVCAHCRNAGPAGQGLRRPESSSSNNGEALSQSETQFGEARTARRDAEESLRQGAAAGDQAVGSAGMAAERTPASANATGAESG